MNFMRPFGVRVVERENRFNFGATVVIIAVFSVALEIAMWRWAPTAIVNTSNGCPRSSVGFDLAQQTDPTYLSCMRSVRFWARVKTIILMTATAFGLLALMAQQVKLFIEDSCAPIDPNAALETDEDKKSSLIVLLRDTFMWLAVVGASLTVAWAFPAS